MRLTMIMVLLLAWAAPSQAQQEAKLVDQVRVSIERGIRFLRDQEKGRGNWEVDAESAARKGGWTSLAMLALLQSGVPPQDEMIQRGLKYLRGLPPEQTYTVGLQTMVYCLAGQPEDSGRVKANVAWLERAMVRHPNLVGWSYAADGAIPDNSNTQYALLGLHEALLAGHQVSPDKLRVVRQFFLQSQQRDGGWTYRGGGFTTMTMTTAGLCNLLICGRPPGRRQRGQLRPVRRDTPGSTGPRLDRHELSRAHEPRGHAPASPCLLRPLRHRADRKAHRAALLRRP
jgi:hypothetical protein